MSLTDPQRAVLRALADHLVPSGPFPSGSALGADAGVAQALAGLAPDQLAGLLALLDVCAVVVDELHLDALDRRPDRARLALAVGVVEGRDR